LNNTTKKNQSYIQRNGHLNVNQ